MNALRWPATAVLLVALAALSACGTDDSGDSGEAQDGSSTASASPNPGGGNQPGADPSQLAAIQQCLEAAGLGDAFPSGGPGGDGTPPSGMPTDFPSDMPTDMPTDMPSDMPTDMPSGGPGGGLGGALQDPEVQAALEACGITLPSAPAASGDQVTN